MMLYNLYSISEQAKTGGRPAEHEGLARECRHMRICTGMWYIEIVAAKKLESHF